MTNRDIHDLTIRLSTGLDQNYDVINMDIVLSVISDLEGTKITKEQLEATRLAKYINHLRRRTKCENLARRAKTLLKKWREMVGIHQASTDNTSQINNSNTGLNENTNLSENVQSHTFSNPGVHTTTYTEDSNYTKAQNIVSVKNQNYTNPSKPYNTTRPGNSQNLNHNNSIGANLDIHNAFGNQQPTSFANLIPELMNEKSNIKNDIRENKQNHSKPVSSIPISCPTETYVIDHSSNSSQESKPGKYGIVSVSEPVVIDIQDSDSEHAQSEPKKFNSINLSTPIPNVNTVTTKSKVKNNTSKLKKYKKEKKKKDYSLMPNQNINCVNITSDTCSNPYQQLRAHDEKSANSFIVANISEILSLSNSSMSTFFPGENDRSSYGVHDNRDLNAHVNNDLTFAGKFKKTNALQNATTIHIRDSIESPAQIISTPSKQDTDAADLSKSIQANCISNESSSSRLSQFDVLDVTSHDSPQGKLTQDQRSLKKIGTTDITNTTSWDNNASSQSALNKYTLASQPSVVPEVKIPKKRGRKKGSKGVDSLIAKETSLSTQILISALGNGGKKVKTTKELYAEMQNRKLNTSQKQKPTLVPLANTNRSISSKANLLLPESSCSEISLQSPQTLDTVSTVQTTSTTNAHQDADSDSGSAISQPSHDSADMKKKISNDSNSDSESCLVKAKKSSEMEENPILMDLKKDLLDIIKQIPSPFSLSEIEKNCTADNVPCSCKVVEVKDNTEEEFKTITEAHRPALPIEEGDSISKSVSKNVERIETNLQKDSKKQEEVNEHQKKPIKSIFDLDFDDDDDPLERIKAEVEAAANQELDTNNSDYPRTEHPEVLDPKETTVEEKLNSQMPEAINDNIKQHVETLPQIPLYKVEEDINCVAKEYFQIRTQKITQFHVDVLHNCFIPNINGNWNQSVLQSTAVIKEPTMENINVVPKYGSFETEAIMKDLSNISFEYNNMKKKRKFATQYNSPFLGVSKLLLEEKLGTEKQNETMKLKNQQILNETVFHGAVNEIENCEKLVELTSALDRYELDGDAQNSVTVRPVLETISVDVDTNNSESLNTLNLVSDDCKNQNLLQIAQDHSLTFPTDATTFLNAQTYVENDDHERENQFFNNSAETSSSRRSSSCSNSSLKITQQSINNKLRKLKLRQEQANLVYLKASNRKRKKKKNISKHDQFDDSNCTKLSNKKKKTVKRLKIAINGDLATQRQICMSRSKTCDEDQNSNSNSETGHSDESVKNDSNDSILEEICQNFNTTDVDEDACCEYDDDDDLSNGVYHEVVTRASTTNGNNHIVLTIKKTPSKTNSPSNSNTISPLNSINNVSLNTINDKDSKIPSSIVLSNCESKSLANTDRNNVEVSFGQTDTVEKTHVQSMPTSPTLATLHKEHSRLFFPDELQMATSNLYEKEFIFKCCNTCYSADGENEHCTNITGNANNFSESEFVSTNKTDSMSENIASKDLSCVSKYDYKCSYSSNVTEHNIEKTNFQTPLDCHLKELSSDKMDEFEGQLSPSEKSFSNDSLPIENNGLLTSFNMIYPASNNATNLKFGQKIEEDFHPSTCTNCDADSNGVLYESSNAMQLVESPKKNCDAHTSENDSSKHSNQSKYNNRNDLNIVSSRNSSKFLCKKSDLNSSNATNSSTLPYKEYSTGIRAVDEDVDDDDGNNCAKIQQFKEWHQVLQLRSYNDELLTVLPYVVLD